MKAIFSWLFLAITVAAGPVGVIIFLRAAFRGLDWPWWMGVVLALAFCVWAWLVDKCLRITTEEAVRRSKESALEMDD